MQALLVLTAAAAAGSWQGPTQQEWQLLQQSLLDQQQQAAEVQLQQAAVLQDLRESSTAAYAALQASARAWCLCFSTTAVVLVQLCARNSNDCLCSYYAAPRLSTCTCCPSCTGKQHLPT